MNSTIAGKRFRIRLAFAPLALACALGGCSKSYHGSDVAALTRVDAPLAWTVNRAQVTHRLVSSSMASRDAAPGQQFVVLDVSVRNRDDQQQVFSEGKLIAMDESELKTFDQPETILSDDYLSLQVLEPSQSLHGKIAYQVPEHMSGVFYWTPGNGGHRILLNLTAPLSQRTLADAAQGDAERADTVPAVPQTPPVTTRATAVARPASPQPAPAVASEEAPEPQGAAAPMPSPTPVPQVIARAAPMQHNVERTTESMPSVTPAPRTPSQGTPSHSAALAAATVVPSSIADVSIATVTPPPILQPPAADVRLAPAATRVIVAAPNADQTRELACQGLVARDDPSEQASKLGFFAESCRDYALPKHWRPQPAARPALLARVADHLKMRVSSLIGLVVAHPRTTVVRDCNAAAAPADRLICGDPRLSAMDHQLAQTVARARVNVDDPAQLQRDQDAWRGRVRKTCNTVDCVEQAYGRRIAQLDALAPMRP